MNQHWQQNKNLVFFSLKNQIIRKLPMNLNIESISANPIHYQRHPLVYLVEAADDICYQIMDLEDAFKLGILSYSEIKELYLDFYDSSTDKKQLKSIEETLTRVTDKNEQVSYLRAGVIGKLIHNCIQVFHENQNNILEGMFEKSWLAICPTYNQRQWIQ